MPFAGQFASRAFNRSGTQSNTGRLASSSGAWNLAGREILTERFAIVVRVPFLLSLGLVSPSALILGASENATVKKTVSFRRANAREVFEINLDLAG